jgi:NTE family protein
MSEKRQRPPEPPKIAVIVSPSVVEARLAELLALSVDPPDERRAADRGVTVELEDRRRAEIHLFSDPEPALARIRRRPMGAVLVDNREPEAPGSFAETAAGRLLPELLAGAPAGRTPSRRLVLVVLPDDETTADHAYAVGSLQLGGVLVDPPSLATALTAAHRLARPARPGKVALCMAGGGIEGMFYELGVLRALDSKLIGGSIADFDIFTGISAGAVLAAFLANGVRPSEIADALHGRPSRVSPITRAILFNPNLGEVAKRVGGAFVDAMRGRWLMQPLETAMRVTPTAVFSGDRLLDYLRAELSKPGMSDRFDDLSRELYIGVTDQETWTHTTFGLERREMPISTAVRASTAMTPYYSPKRVGERYYVDGIFTRTIDLDTAVARGARLLICIDPLTPVQDDRPGYVSGRGGFFNTVQSIKSMIRTRFSELIGRAEEAYPDVSVFLFSPTPRDLEQMSGTMMRFLTRTETEQMAFESSLERIRRDYDWLAADFRRYGFELTE